jgi:hypothetical protein
LFMADESVNNAPFQPLNPCGSTFFGYCTRPVP